MKARRAFLVLLTAGVVGTAAWLVFFSPVLGVRSVEVVGNLTVDTASIQLQAAVPDLKPLATVNLTDVEARVLGLRKIATAKAVRAWPGTLRIEVVEREPVAVVPVSGKSALMDKDGVVTELKDIAPPRLPVLRLDRPGPGDPATLAALKVIGELPEDLARRVDEVRATSAEGISLKLNDGRTVVWGGTDRGADKARILAGLLKRKATVYDVSSPDVVTMK